MTIAAGFNFTDGVLICADTKHSGGLRLFASKVFVKDDYANGSKSVFAYAGDMGYSRMGIQHCEAAIAKTPRADSATLRSKVESEIAKLHREHIYRHPNFKTGMLCVKLVIGLWSPIDGLRTYNTQDSQVMEFPGYALAGTGDYLGHYLIRPQYVDSSSPLEIVTSIAATALASIKEFDDDCGGRTYLVVLRKDGTISPLSKLDTSRREDVALRIARASGALSVAVSKPEIDANELDKALSDFCSDVESAVKGATANTRLLKVIEDLGPGKAEHIRRTVLADARIKRSISRNPRLVR